MDNLRKNKEITYLSEYVSGLESKLEFKEQQLEHLKAKSQQLEFSIRLQDAHTAYYLGAYKEALKQAIGDAMPFVSDWSLMIAEGYEEEQKLLFDCMDNNKSSIEGIAEFYFRMVCKRKTEEEWGKRK